MKKVSFIHCADLHLDMPFKHLGSTGKVMARRKDLLDVFDSIINMAEDTGADMLLVSGDLYEHEYALRRTMQHVRDGFNRIKDIPVILLPGNHDPFTANSFYNVVEWSENVHILCAEKPSVHIDRTGTSIYGAGWESSVEEGLERISKADIDPKNINILMFHGTIDVFADKKGYNFVSSAQLAALEMDYIATRHIFQTQLKTSAASYRTKSLFAYNITRRIKYNNTGKAKNQPSYF
jgi:exonuclease SbcD